MLLKIPIKLTSEANSNEHWTKKAKRHKTQKTLVWAYMKRSDNYPCPCTITMTRWAPRAYDSDNLQTSMKYLRDAVSEHILGCKLAGRADSDPRLNWIYKQEKTKDEEYYVTIEICEWVTNTSL